MKRGIAASAFAFVLTMGLVNLFADVTYEGGVFFANCTAKTFPLVGCLKMGMDLSTSGYETTNSWQ